MQDQTSMFWLFIFRFFQRENDKLVKGNEVFCFSESHYNDFMHILFDSTKLYIFTLVINFLQKLKNGPLYSGHPKLSKFVRFLYMKDYQCFLNQNCHNLCWKSVLKHAWRNEMAISW